MRNIVNFLNGTGCISHQSFRLFRISLSLFLTFQFMEYFSSYDWLMDSKTGVFGNCWLDQQKNMPVAGLSWSRFSLLIPVLIGILWCSEFFSVFWGTLLAVMLSLFYQRYPVLYFGWIQIFVCYLQVSVCIQLFLKYDKNAYLPVWASLILLFQIGSVYTLNAISKTGNLWISGQAVEYALKSYYTKTWLTDSILSYPLLLKVLNYMTLFWELLVGPFVLLSLRYKKLLFPLCTSIACFHFGMSFFLDVGNFYWMGLAVFFLGLPKFLKPPQILKFLTIKRSIKISLPEKYGVVLLVLPILFIFSHSTQSNSFDNKKEWKLTHTFPFSLSYTMFTQYWHYYSPDPPYQNGFLMVQLTSNNGRTFFVENGKKVELPVTDVPIKKYVYQYLLIRYNKKYSVDAQICLMQKELAMYKKIHTDTIVSVSSVLYRYEKDDQYQKIENIRLNIK